MIKNLTLCDHFCIFFVRCQTLFSIYRNYSLNTGLMYLLRVFNYDSPISHYFYIFCLKISLVLCTYPWSGFFCRFTRYFCTFLWGFVIISRLIWSLNFGVTLRWCVHHITVFHFSFSCFKTTRIGTTLTFYHGGETF